MRQLFVMDPLERINPAKDSTAALMQAAQRAGHEVWASTPADLIALGDEPWVVAVPVEAEPWLTIGEPQRQQLLGHAGFERREAELSQGPAVTTACYGLPR